MVQRQIDNWNLLNESPKKDDAAGPSKSNVGTPQKKSNVRFDNKLQVEKQKILPKPQAPVEEPNLSIPNEGGDIQMRVDDDDDEVKIIKEVPEVKQFDLSQFKHA